MSGEIETFRKIHNSYKKLQRLRGLLTLKSKINPDVHDVFSSYLSDLLTAVSSEYENCVRHSSPNRHRLAAMILALNYEMTKTSLLVADSPKPSSLESLENCLQEFNDDKLSDELFLIYFRALNYLWLLYASRFPNVLATATDYSTRVEKMYDALNQDSEHKFYDCQQLFAKTLQMPTMERGREEIDDLLAKNLQQLEVVYQGAGDTENLAKILQRQLKIRNANIPRLIWVQKIIALAPPLISESKNKMAAYYLIVAMKMLRECSELDQKSNDFTSVRLALAAEWMNYAFAALTSSNNFLRATFSDEEIEPLAKFLPQLECDETVTSKSHFDKIGDTHMVDSFDTAKLFDSIRLSPQEISFCMQSIEDISSGQKLFNYVIGIIDDFIGSTDASATPMDYIIYQYQLLDLLLIRSIFEEECTSRYTVLKLRFERCDEMIQTLNEQCPKVFEIANGWILNDLNEILLDLYQCNLMLINMSNNDVRMLREKLKELRMVTLAKN